MICCGFDKYALKQWAIHLNEHSILVFLIVQSLGLCLIMAPSILLLESTLLLVLGGAVDALPEWKDLECQVLKIFPDIIRPSKKSL